MNKSPLLAGLTAFALVSGAGFMASTAQSASSGYVMDRNVLPIQPPPPTVVTEMDARNATKPERFEIKAPEGAPNVVIVLIDDIGFGATEPFGGAYRDAHVRAPRKRRSAIQSVSHDGALLADPGFAPFRPEPPRGQCRLGDGDRDWIRGQSGRAARRRQVLRRERCARTATARRPLASGMKHRPGKSRCPGRTSDGRRTPVSTSSSGSSAAKPTSGIPSSSTESPRLPKTDDPGLPLHDPHDGRGDCEWVKFQQAMTPEKPFMIYYATGATHAPHHAPEGVHREVRGPVRRGLARLPEGDLRATEGDGRSFRRTPSWLPCRRTSRTGNR